MMDTLFASRLTTITRVSSEVRAMVVEWVGAAAPRPTSPPKPAIITITKRAPTRPFLRHRGNRTKVDRLTVVLKIIYTPPPAAGRNCSAQSSADSWRHSLSLFCFLESWWQKGQPFAAELSSSPLVDRKENRSERHHIYFQPAEIFISEW